MARNTARTLITTANVAYDVLAPRLRKTIIITMPPTAPITMNGLRTLTRSEMIPIRIRAMASNPQNQSPMLLAFDSEKPCSAVKYTVKNPTAV